MLFRHDFLLRLSTNNMDSSDSRVSVKMLKKKATRGIRTRNQGMEGCVPNQLRHRGSSGGRNRSNRSLDREIRFATGALPRVPDSVHVDFYIIIVSTIPPALIIADFRGVGTGQSFTKKFGGKFREINGEPSLLRSMCDMGSRPHFFP